MFPAHSSEVNLFLILMKSINSLNNDSRTVLVLHLKWACSKTPVFLKSVYGLFLCTSSCSGRTHVHRRLSCTRAGSISEKPSLWCLVVMPFCTPKVPPCGSLGKYRVIKLQILFLRNPTTDF